MKTLVILLVGIIAGALGYHYFAREKTASPGSSAPWSEAVPSRERIQEELDQTGQAIREKAKEAGDAITDAASNARITATIKSRLIQESPLDALKIDVDTTAGVVTLSGAVATQDQIDKAVKIASETEGVHRVVSSLQIKAD